MHYCTYIKANCTKIGNFLLNTEIIKTILAILKDSYYNGYRNQEQPTLKVMSMSNLVNQVATEAAKLSKSVSKANAFDILKVLINDGKIAVGDAATLYKHFMPRNPAKPKTLTDWVAKIVPKKDVRYYINYLNVRIIDGEKVLVATDGFRLHCTNTDLELGSYDIALNKIDDALAGYNSYPNVAQVIWDKNIAELSIKVEDYKEWISLQERRIVNNVQCIVLATEEGNEVFISDKQLSDALCSNDSGLTIYIRNSSTTSQSILVEGDNTKSVIMPIRPA